MMWMPVLFQCFLFLPFCTVNCVQTIGWTSKQRVLYFYVISYNDHEHAGHFRRNDILNINKTAGDDEDDNDMTTVLMKLKMTTTTTTTTTMMIMIMTMMMMMMKIVMSMSIVRTKTIHIAISKLNLCVSL